MADRYSLLLVNSLTKLKKIADKAGFVSVERCTRRYGMQNKNGTIRHRVEKTTLGEGYAFSMSRKNGTGRWYDIDQNRVIFIDASGYTAEARENLLEAVVRALRDAGVNVEEQTYTDGTFSRYVVRMYAAT